MGQNLKDGKRAVKCSSLRCFFGLLSLHKTNGNRKDELKKLLPGTCQIRQIAKEVVCLKKNHVVLDTNLLVVLSFTWGFCVVILEKKQEQKNSCAFILVPPHTVQHSLSMLLLRWDLDKFTTNKCAAWHTPLSRTLSKTKLQFLLMRNFSMCQCISSCVWKISDLFWLTHLFSLLIHF